MTSDAQKCLSGDAEACARLGIGANALKCDTTGDPEACAKAAMEEAMVAGCQAAATAYGLGAAAPLCGPLAAFIVAEVYPLIRDLAIGIVTGKLLVSLLPDSLLAHGVYSPNVATMILWAGPKNDFPIVGVYRDAIEAIQAAWDVGRAKAGLPPAPFAVSSALLTPQKGGKLELVSTDSTGTLNVPPSVAERWRKSSVELDAEDALLRWLHEDPEGWSSPKLCWGAGIDDGSGGNAKVWLTDLPGIVDDVLAMPDPAHPDNIIGQGPFGLKAVGWPSDCGGGCRNQFNACVRMLWNYRLKGLQRAVPGVLAAVSTQIAIDRREYAAGVVKRAAVATLALGAAAGAAYGAAVHWPQITRFLKSVAGR